MSKPINVFQNKILFEQKVTTNNLILLQTEQKPFLKYLDRQASRNQFNLKVKVSD